MRLINLLFSFILTASVGIAQNNSHLTDSLLIQLSTSKTDTEKEIAYRNLCETYSFTNTDSAIFYGLKSIELCNKHQSINGIEYVYYLLGETYLDVSLEESKSYFFKAIGKSKITRNDSVEHLAYFGLSSYYSNFSNIDSTLYYNTKSKNYFETKKDTNALINCYYNMMSIYSMTFDFETVIEYGLLCESLFTKERNHFLNGDIFIGLSFAYDRNGINNDLEKARYYLREAEKIALEMNNLGLLSNVYQVQGIRYYRAKEYKKAIIQFNKSLEISIQLKDGYRMSTTSFSIGSCYFKIGNNDEAAKHFKKVDDDFGVLDKKKANLYLALIYSNIDKTQSLKYLNEHNKLSKLLKSEKDSELLIEYESLEKEKENLALSIENKDKELQTQIYKLQAQKNKFYLFLGIISFSVILVVGLLYFRYKRQQAKVKIVNLQKQALQLQLNPHFFFNALNSINAYVGKQETGKAKYYLGKFSKLMRLTLENSQLDFVTLEDELSFLENYMTLEQMNSNNFEFEINVNDDLLDVKIPSMLLQPFVENSIEHAFNGITQKGEIKIIIAEVPDFLIVSIIDNGVGIKNTSNVNEHKSLGIELLHKRIDLYSKGHSKIKFSVPFPNQPNVGAKVTFKIPIKAY